VKRRGLLAVLSLTLGVAAGCAKAPPPRIPAGEDYVFPVSDRRELRPEEARAVDDAWRDLLAGEAATAERAFSKLLTRHPRLDAAEAGIGYARLRAGRPEAAGAAFESVLQRRPDHLPSLVGAAAVARRLGDPEKALALLHRAQAAAPNDALVRRRLSEVKLQVTERRVAAAKAALEAGDQEAAEADYREALDAAPEVGGLRIELANLIEARGDVLGAVAVLEMDPVGDRQVLLRLAEILMQQNDPGAALSAYGRILARDPRDPDAARGASQAREALELLRMPEEYRQIYTASRISRADLAALIAVKVTRLSRLTAGEPEVAVDISGSWAREHIIKVLAYRVMEVYPNHTFQPGAAVRRGDLAQAVGAVLDLLNWPGGPAPPISDMTRAHLFHQGATRSVAAGLMDVTSSGAFEAWRPVSGREAIDVVEALVRLVGP
jgi:tetratricopeptide (TPR) repeat protein